MIRMVSMRDLRNTPGKFWKTLKGDKAVALAVNGVPRAVVVDIADGDLEEVVSLVTRVRAQQATEMARRLSAARGTDRMTMDEINSEIATVRQERVTRGSKPHRRMA
jgi:hypothetical protein